MMQIPDEIHGLIFRFSEGGLSEAEAERLSAWITASPGHARHFYRVFAEERALAIALGGRQIKAGHNAEAGAADNNSVLDALADMEANAPIQGLADLTARLESDHEPVAFRIQPVSKSNGPRVIVIPRLAATAALAAMVLLGIWAAYSIFDRADPTPAQNPPLAVQPEAPAEVLAHLRSSADAVVRTAAGTPVRGPMIGGEYRVDEGLVGIEMASGVRLVIEGPARLVLEGPNAARLDQGKLVATVPPVAWGFTVNTPTARIVDYGTVFGVHADDLIGTEIHVFEGEVRAAVRSDEDGAIPGAFISLLANEAAAVDAMATAIRPIAFAATGFERDVVKWLDMVDIVAGGDGTTGRRDIGLNPVTGGYLANLQGTYDFISTQSDGSLRVVHDNPLLKGIFIPDVDGQLDRLPNGFELPPLPPSNGQSYGLVWCGGESTNNATDHAAVIPVKLGATDFAKPGHQALTMHTNVGLVLDLDAIRAAHPGYDIRSIRATVGNSAVPNVPVTPGTDRDFRSDFLVLLDDSIQRHLIFQLATPQDQRYAELDLAIAPEHRYLTLVSHDGDGSNYIDWVIVGDPVLVLEPAVANSTGAGPIAP